jgi:hypothetical protein
MRPYIICHMGTSIDGRLHPSPLHLACGPIGAHRLSAARHQPNFPPIKSFQIGTRDWQLRKDAKSRRVVI